MPYTVLTAGYTAPLLGVSTGLRAFTPLAVTAWFAIARKLQIEGTWASWVGHPVSVGLFTAAALGEYIGDKLPSTPNRTAPLPLAGRLLLGGFLARLSRLHCDGGSHAKSCSVHLEQQQERSEASTRVAA